MGDEILGALRSARLCVKEEQKTWGSRELSLVLTKLDEAVMWRERDIFLKNPSDDKCDDG